MYIIQPVYIHISCFAWGNQHTHTLAWALKYYRTIDNVAKQIQQTIFGDDDEWQYPMFNHFKNASQMEFRNGNNVLSWKHFFYENKSRH